jgi:hypothetical protein
MSKKGQRRDNSLFPSLPSVKTKILKPVKAKTQQP